MAIIFKPTGILARKGSRKHPGSAKPGTQDPSCVRLHPVVSRLRSKGGAGFSDIPINLGKI